MAALKKTAPGAAMSVTQVLDAIKNDPVGSSRLKHLKHPKVSVQHALSTNKRRLFKRVGSGMYVLAGTPTHNVK